MRLVRVERRDPLLGGAVFFVLEPGFLQGVQLAMPGQKDGRPGADLQILRCDAHAGRAKRFHLRPQVFKIQGHVAAEDVDDAFPKHAGREQMQREFAQVVDHRMPRVSPALIANDVIIPLRQQIDHAALAFVAPVDPYDCTVSHLRSSKSIPFQRPQYFCKEKRPSFGGTNP